MEEEVMSILSKVDKEILNYIKNAGGSIKKECVKEDFEPLDTTELLVRLEILGRVLNYDGKTHITKYGLEDISEPK
jgi:hypothetical protein